MNSYSEAVPAPWKSRGISMAGGFIGVGFGQNSDLALVVTHNGRGLIDCLTGKKIARDKKPVYPDGKTRRIQGIGLLSDSSVIVAGIDGGELRNKSDDGWRLDGKLTNISQDEIRLLPPMQKTSIQPKIFTEFIPEVRVFGFSPTYRSFIIATGAEVFIYAR